MKILLCNEAFIGDMILSTAVLPPLKKLFSHCQIGFLTTSLAKKVIENHELIDFIHIHDLALFNRQQKVQQWKKSQEKKSYKNLVREISDIEYDIAIDLHSYFRANSSHIMYKASIPKRYGYWYCPQVFFYTHPLFWDCTKLHALENHYMMMRHIGISEEDLNPFKPYLAYKNSLSKPPFLPEKYFCIHPHAGWPDKEWRVEKWKTMLEKMDRWKIPLVILGKGQRDIERSQAMVGSSKNVLNLCDKLNFRETLETIKNARFLIGMDSMAGHLAASFGVPALLLYNGRSAQFDWRPYHPYCHVIKAKAHFWEKLDEIKPNKPIDMIEPQEVLTKAERILKAHSLL